MYFAVAKKKKKHEKGYLKISFLEKSAINGAPFSEFIIHFWEIVSLALSSCYWVLYFKVWRNFFFVSKEDYVFRSHRQGKYY